MLMRILQWRQDSRDLRSIREARQISRQAALNALHVVTNERKTGQKVDGPGRRS